MTGAEPTEPMQGGIKQPQYHIKAFHLIFFVKYKPKIYAISTFKILFKFLFKAES
jgi:hypothetical protein